MSKTQSIYSKIIFIVLIILQFISCNKKEGKNLDDKLTINIGSEYVLTGLVDISGEDHLCFVKRQFKPNIKIYNAKGLLTDSIPLVEAEKILGTITHIWMASADSVYAYSSNNSSLVLVDNKGLPLSQKSYYDIADMNGNHYSLYLTHPFYLFTPTKYKSLFFRTYVGWQDSGHTDIQKLDNIRKNGFLICKVDPSSQKEENGYIFGFPFANIEEFSATADNSLCFDPFYYTLIVNDRIFLFSEYSRYIYELSDSLMVKNKIQVIDEQAAIVFPLPVKPGDNLQAKTDETLLHLVDAMAITNILYNPVTDNYLVIIKDGEVKNRNWQNFPFKVQLYDQDFVKIKEIKVDNYNYIPRKSFIMNGKLYMKKESESHGSKEYEPIVL